MFCPNCGNQVSSLGGNCPHCGRDTSIVKSRRAWPWVLLSIATLLLATFGSCAYVVGTAVDEFDDPSTLLGQFQAEDEFMFESFSDMLMQQLTPRAEEFLAALQKGAPEQAYTFTHPSFKAETDLLQFKSITAEHDLENLPSYTIIGFGYFSEANPYLSVDVSHSDGKEETIFLDMEMDDGQWLVSLLTFN